MIFIDKGGEGGASASAEDEVGASVAKETGGQVSKLVTLTM